MRRFAGADAGCTPVPDETAVLRFHHLLEAFNLGAELFRLIGQYLKESGLNVSRDTITYETIISASSSTRHKKGKRGPEMHQAGKGNGWCFSVKGHMGVDSRMRLIHSVAVTSVRASSRRFRRFSELLTGRYPASNACPEKSWARGRRQ